VETANSKYLFPDIVGIDVEIALTVLMDVPAVIQAPAGERHAYRRALMDK